MPLNLQVDSILGVMVTHLSAAFLKPLFDKPSCRFFKVVPCLGRLGIAEKEWKDTPQQWKEVWRRRVYSTLGGREGGSHSEMQSRKADSCAHDGS